MNDLSEKLNSIKGIVLLAIDAAEKRFNDECLLHLGMLMCEVGRAIKLQENKCKLTIFKGGISKFEWPEGKMIASHSSILGAIEILNFPINEVQIEVREKVEWE